MPTRENNEAILKKLNIKPITAQLIVDLEKDFNNRSLGPEQCRQSLFRLSHRF